ncbi:hypothetical protein TNCV_640921 [Trichonephila clavipes]|nr:hypothetical protein TNCV_640921 [Trichonephila clavipes]
MRVNFLAFEEPIRERPLSCLPHAPKITSSRCRIHFSNDWLSLSRTSINQHKKYSRLHINHQIWDREPQEAHMTNNSLPIISDKTKFNSSEFCNVFFEAACKHQILRFARGITFCDARNAEESVMETITAPEHFFIPELNNHGVQELWFQQDGATCHTARVTKSIYRKTRLVTA